MPELNTLGAPIATAYEGQPDKNAFTDAEKDKLQGIEDGAQINTVTSVNGDIGAVVIDVSGEISSAIAAQKGATNGLAPLVGGFVPIENIPGQALDVQEYNNLAAFPVTGISETLYIAKDTNKQYRWTGSTYVQLNNLTKSDIGLGNVDNTSDLNKPLSTAAVLALLDKMPNNFKYLKKWRKAKAGVLAGVANARIFCFGDSTTIGVGATLATAWPRLLGKLFSSAGYPVQMNGFFGQGYNYNMDARIVPSGNFVMTNVYGIGGRFFQLNASGTAGKITFTPTEQVNQFKIWYVRFSGGGTISCSIDGGVASTAATGTGSGIGSITMNTTLGNHSIEVTVSAGTFVFFYGIECSDTTKNSLMIFNCGSGGTSTTDWYAANAAWSAAQVTDDLTPDLTMIALGINDWASSIPIATYKSNLQAIITNALITGDVVLICPVPSATSVRTLEIQRQYCTALYELAATNGLLVIDWHARMESYEIASVLGYYALDGLHPNAYGYGDLARDAFNQIGAP